MLGRLNRLQKRLLAGLVRTLPVVPRIVLDLVACLTVAVPTCWVIYCYAFVLPRTLPGLLDGGTELLANIWITLILLLCLASAPLVMAIPQITNLDGFADLHRVEALCVAVLVALIWTGVHACQEREPDKVQPDRRDFL